MTMSIRDAARLYVVDPNDPRAPSTDVWNAMTDEERMRVAEALPGRAAYKRLKRNWERHAEEAELQEMQLKLLEEQWRCRALEQELATLRAENELMRAGR